MESLNARFESPVSIALTYFVLGVSWILVTDYLVVGLAGDSQTMLQLQTAKGWLFVAGSTVLVYVLVRSNVRRHEETTDRLEHALQQTSVLHRLLRHNLRNNCNVIQGNVELLEADEAIPTTADPRFDEITAQTEQLVELGSKTRYLRDAVIEGDDPVRRLDLGTVVDAVVATTQNRYPDATIETDVPNECFVRTTPRLERAIEELVDNAIEHNDRSAPTVRLEIRRMGEGVDIVVSDDGPGLPATERAVLDGGVESPMVHSEGLGLWIARTIVVQTGGSLGVADDESRGTAVVLSLPT